MENSSVGVTVPVTFKACLQEADREAAAHGRGNAAFGAPWDPRPNPAFSLPCSPSPSGHFSSPPVAFMSAWHATALIITRLPQPQYKLHARLLSSSIFSAE